MAIWAPEEGLEMSEWVSDKWANLRTKDIWHFWDDNKWHGLVHGIFDESGILNDEPLLNFMADNLSFKGKYGDGRISIVAATSANTGEEVKMSSFDLPFEDWPRAVVSSASLPGLFPL